MNAPTEVVIYSPLQYALYTSSVLIPVIVSCVVFLIAFLALYALLDSILNITNWSGMQTHIALGVGTAIAIGCFIWML
jgi:hypothetical protein